MADLDEVSSQIGALVAMSTQHDQRAQALLTKLDKINEEVIEQRGAVKLLGTTLADTKLAVGSATARIDTLEKQASEVKNTSKGLLIGVSLVGGGGGLAGFFTAAKHWWSS